MLDIHKDSYSGAELGTAPTGNYLACEVSLSKVATKLANETPVKGTVQWQNWYQSIQYDKMSGRQVFFTLPQF